MIHRLEGKDRVKFNLKKGENMIYYHPELDDNNEAFDYQLLLKLAQILGIGLSYVSEYCQDIKDLRQYILEKEIENDNAIIEL
jgi:hypothetical protein